MFIVLLTYRRPLEEVDALIEAHRDWLAPNLAEGVFFLTGRRVPRTGGVILAHGLTRAELDRRLAEDPFQAVADYEVIEVAPASVSEHLAFLAKD